MKKLIAIAAMALTTSAFAADSYLYWMLDSVSFGEEEKPQYNQVKIGVMDTGTGKNVAYLSLYDINGTSVGGTGDTVGNVQVESGFALDHMYAQISEAYYKNGYSYYIELLNDGKFVGRTASSDILNYASAETYIRTSMGQTAVPGTAWTSANFTTAAIPEPTSGLLMLFGLSALALRRKRMA